MKQDVHLNDDQIIRSLEDKTDLSVVLQEHLASCSQCLSARKKLEGAVVRLGEQARNSAPLFKKAIRFPDRQPLKTSWWSWNWRSFSAMGATAGMAIAIIVLVSLHTMHQRSLAKLYDEMFKDERFISEINMLGKNDLPQLWMDISGDSEVNLNEEMLEVIAPGT